MTEQDNDAAASVDSGDPQEMDREKHRPDFETLGLAVDASLEEVETSYGRLRTAYDPEALSMSGAEEQAAERDRRRVMIEELEAAHGRLLAFFGGAPDTEPEPPASGEVTLEPLAGEDATAPEPLSVREADPTLVQEAAETTGTDMTVYSGQTLKEIREKLGVTLEEISRETKILVRTLESLEDENYAVLPPEVYVKGFVKAYAMFLSVDPKSAVSTYMEKYHAWKHEKKRRHLPFRFARKKEQPPHA